MFLVLLFLVFVILYLLRRQYAYQTSAIKKHGDKIPGPKPLPIIGNCLQFGFSNKSLFDFMIRTTREYGPVFRIWIGSSLGVFLVDPPTIELLLGNYKHLKKASLYQFTKTWLGNGLVVSTGATWNRHRKIVTPTFHIKTLQKFLDVFNSNIDTLIEKLLETQQETQFNICEWMDLFTLDAICETAMGVKVNAMVKSNSEFVKGVRFLLKGMYKRAFRPWLHPDIIFRLSSLGRQEVKYLSIIQGMSGRIIKARKLLGPAASPNETEDSDIGAKNKLAFLDLLLQHAEGENLSYEEIQDEVNTFLVAGHETTSGCLSYTCWLLAKHQVIQDKAVEELKRIFGDSLRHATFQDLNEMKYLEQVLKESLRLLPPVPIVARRITEDIVTDKYVIPAGCDVAVFVYMVHRHPDYFPDPEKFDPDRFLPENCLGRHPYCYLPFSAGPRSCLGYKFSMYEMKATLAKLLRHFKILPAENPFMDLDLTAHITLKSRNGVIVKLQPRNFAQE